MLCSEIFTASLKLLGEVGGAEENPDYAERAPYIIASFASEAIEVDERYRMAHGIEKNAFATTVMIGLDQSFPLSERLASSCALYLASMLIADESPELSEELYEKYCDSISSVCRFLPHICEEIKNVY